MRRATTRLPSPCSACASMSSAARRDLALAHVGAEHDEQVARAGEAVDADDRARAGAWPPARTGCRGRRSRRRASTVSVPYASAAIACAPPMRYTRSHAAQPARAEDRRVDLRRRRRAARTRRRRARRRRARSRRPSPPCSGTARDRRARRRRRSRRAPRAATTLLALGQLDGARPRRRRPRRPARRWRSPPAGRRRRSSGSCLIASSSSSGGDAQRRAARVAGGVEARACSRAPPRRPPRARAATISRTASLDRRAASGTSERTCAAAPGGAAEPLELPRRRCARRRISGRARRRAAPRSCSSRSSIAPALSLCATGLAISLRGAHDDLLAHDEVVLAQRRAGGGEVDDRLDHARSAARARPSP